MILRHDIRVYSNGAFILKFPYIASVSIESSKNSYTDTAELTFTDKIFKNGNRITDYISVGNKIVIQLSYESYPEEVTTFSGYVVEISTTENTTIKLEDEAFLYKTAVITPKVFKNTTLKDLISYYYKDTFYSADVEIGDWVVNKNATLINLFDELRSKLGMLCYWQNSILYVGAEITRTGRTIIFNVNENVPYGTDDIKTTRPEDSGVVSYGLSQQKNGTKIERYAYYSDATRSKIITTSVKPIGTINELKLPNITQTKLDYWIKRRLPNLYTNTNTGQITTFGVPVIEHGDFAKVIDGKKTDVSGIYGIIGVTKIFSPSEGFKQTAKIGLKV